MMKQGDRVRVIKGEHNGEIGIILHTGEQGEIGAWSEGKPVFSLVQFEDGEEVRFEVSQLEVIP